MDVPRLLSQIRMGLLELSAYQGGFSELNFDECSREYQWLPKRKDLSCVGEGGLQKLT